MVSTKHEVQIYTRDVENSNLKELKMTFVVKNIGLNEIVSAFNNTTDYTAWVHKCYKAEVLETLSSQETVEYYAYDFPWPLSNRDCVSRSIFSQDSLTRVVTLETTVAEGFENAPTAQEHVRIPELLNKWILTPTVEGHVEIEYFLKTSPGGRIPDWAVNLAIDHGALKTILNLRAILESRKYRNYVVPWLQN